MRAVLVGMAAGGALRLDVEAVYPLEAAADAAAASETPGRSAKVALSPEPV
jgi:hypothetical protein